MGSERQDRMHAEHLRKMAQEIQSLKGQLKEVGSDSPKHASLTQELNRLEALYLDRKYNRKNDD